MGYTGTLVSSSSPLDNTPIYYAIGREIKEAKVNKAEAETGVIALRTCKLLRSTPAAALILPDPTLTHCDGSIIGSQQPVPIPTCTCTCKLCSYLEVTSPTNNTPSTFPSIFCPFSSLPSFFTSPTGRSNISISISTTPAPAPALDAGKAKASHRTRFLTATRTGYSYRQPHHDQRPTTQLHRPTGTPGEGKASDLDDRQVQIWFSIEQLLVNAPRLPNKTLVPATSIASARPSKNLKIIGRMTLLPGHDHNHTIIPSSPYLDTYTYTYTSTSIHNHFG
ncbi:hypothetical protein HYFRA_00012049 [Hymenoscyphus fraxineus]|uniref:Uncharacterized protein n=1 Tax=Hymenoscyphus fraxineus TaxID=746836 RepID=A0A9N9L230_9HELO|nr:hypothetical protein HYFRA_00012049 [Hymenoscyphus fraxineus]